MSSLILNTLPITEIRPHENADALELAVFQGWTCVVKKGQFKQGDIATYFPPDLLLPVELGEELNVVNYLKKMGKNYPDRDKFAGRVAVARLRGVPSYGILVHPRPEWLEHVDHLAEYLGVEKYVQPEEQVSGYSERTNPFFHKYTDIENLRNFPHAFEDGETVIVTEKIHGRNVRIGLCYEDGEMVLMGGSHGVRRRQYDPEGRTSMYWRPVELFHQIQDMLQEIFLRYQHNVVLYGEIYGPGMQDLQYGEKQIAFRAFDIAVNTRYLDHAILQDWLDYYEIPMVPVLYKGSFSWDKMNELVDGNTTLTSLKQIREGIVIRPEVEAFDINGRKIYKLISFDYLNRKGGSENH